MNSLRSRLFSAAIAAVVWCCLFSYTASAHEGWGIVVDRQGQIYFTDIPTNTKKVWEKKPYTQWTLSEVMRILTNSPWAQTAFETTYVAYNVPGTSYSATVRLRSALPIRQALVRQKQLAVNYDKLNSVERARFDAETKEFLQCPDCSKYYIVTLVYVGRQIGSVLVWRSVISPG